MDEANPSNAAVDDLRALIRDFLSQDVPLLLSAGTLRNPLHELAMRLARTVGLDHVRFIWQRCSVWYAQDLARMLGGREPAGARDLRFVEAARRGEYFSLFQPDEGNRSEAVTVIPVYEPDDERKAILGVLVLRGIDQGQFGIRRSSLASVGEAFGASILRDRNRNLLSAQRKLIAISGSVPVASDLCYRVAKRIRQLIGYDGRCYVLSWRRSMQLLRIMAALRGQASTPIRALDVQDERLVAVGTDISQVFLPDSYPVVARSNGNGWTYDACGQFPAGQPVSNQKLQDFVCLIDGRLNLGKSFVLCPLFWARSLIGLVVVTSEHQDAFTQHEQSVICDLAPYCTFRLATDIRIDSEFELLGKSARTPEHPDGKIRTSPYIQILSLFCDRLRQHRGADIALLANIEQGETLPARALISSSLQQTLTIEPDDHLRYVFETALRDRSNSEIEWLISRGSAIPENSILGTHRLSGYIATPLRYTKNGQHSHGGAIGVLLLGYRSDLHKRPRESGFTHADKAWLRVFREPIEEYLSRHLDDMFKRRLDTSIQRIYSALAHDCLTKDDLEKTLEIIFETGLELVGATAGILVVPSSTSSGLRVAFKKNVGENADTEIAPGRGVSGACYSSARPILIPNLSDKTTWPAGVEPLPWVDGSLCELAVPLMRLRSGSPIGVLDVESQARPFAFGDQELEALTTLADASVVAIELRTNLTLLESLQNLSQKIRNAATVEVMYRFVLTEARDVTGSSSACLHLIDPTFTTLDPIFAVPTHEHEQSVLKTTGTLGYAFSYERTCYVEDVTAPSCFPRGLQYNGGRPDTRCELAVPLSWLGVKLGVMNFHHVQPAGLSPYKLYIESLASQVSYSLYQRRLSDTTEQKSSSELLSMISNFAVTVSHDIKKSVAHIENSLRRSDLDAAYAGVEQTQRELKELLDWIPFEGRPVVGIDLIDCLRRATQGDQVLTFVRRSDLPQSVIVDGREGLLDWCLRQIIRNSERHHATQIGLSINERGPSVELELADDGEGLPHGIDLEEMYRAERTNLTPKGQGHALVVCRAYLRTVRGNIRSVRVEPRGLITIITLVRRD